jgi:RecA-family ATPase
MMDEYDGLSPLSYAEQCRLADHKRRGNGNDKAPELSRGVSWDRRLFSAAALRTMEFPPLKWILPDLVPEGATLVVSRPKLGKSWLVLDIAIAVTASRFTLGTLKPNPGAALYLALEDGRRRLQRRMAKLMPTFSSDWPTFLEFATEWPRADQGGLRNIEAWIESHPNARLIVIDTLAQFRPKTNGKANYADDYTVISDLQKLAGKYNVGIIIVHHDRKGEADDVFDTVSGTLGLTGAADTILVMKRQAGTVTMSVRGRDIEEIEKALQFDKQACRWSILGEAADVQQSDTRGKILTVLKTASEPMTPTEIRVATELTRENVDTLLFRMSSEGQITKISRGNYIHIDRQDLMPSTPREKRKM